jgi:hypothetical protein
MADIGEPQREVTFEPLPDAVPQFEPAPELPAEEPAAVPA